MLGSRRRRSSTKDNDPVHARDRRGVDSSRCAKSSAGTELPGRLKLRSARLEPAMRPSDGKSGGPMRSRWQANVARPGRECPRKGIELPGRRESEGDAAGPMWAKDREERAAPEPARSKAKGEASKCRLRGAGTRSPGHKAPCKGGEAPGRAWLGTGSKAPRVAKLRVEVELSKQERSEASNKTSRCCLAIKNTAASKHPDVRKDKSDPKATQLRANIVEAGCAMLRGEAEASG